MALGGGSHLEEGELRRRVELGGGRAQEEGGAGRRDS